MDRPIAARAIDRRIRTDYVEGEVSAAVEAGADSGKDSAAAEVAAAAAAREGWGVSPLAICRGVIGQSWHWHENS
jgi:hypothetical protein